MNFHLKKAGKCISVLLVALLVLSSAPLSGFAGLELPVLAADAAETVASGSCGDSVTWTLDEDGVLTLSGTGATNDYTIEEGGRSPFYDHADAIQTLVVADGITGIGQLLFAECTALSSVSIPDSVTFIGAGAFYYCCALTSFDVPDEVTALGEMIFYNCYSLVQIDLSAALTSIGSYAFYDCNALVSVNIPSGVASIGEQAFGQCDGLVSVTLPDTLTVVGASAFAWCSALTGIELPESVGTVCEGAFADCPAMEKVIVRNAECVIEGDAENSAFSAQTVIYGFAGSTAETYAETCGNTFVLLSDFVLAQGECGINATWTLADGVLTISGAGAMYDYADFEASALSAAPWYADADSVHTVIIEDGITHIGDWAFDQCNIDEGVTIPDSVTSIGTFAFRATDLPEITIPDSVRSIGDGVFGYNYFLHNVILSENNKYFVIENGTLFDMAKTTLICCFDRSVSSVYTIPPTVRRIGSLAFCYCTQLTEIIIPDGVTSIGNGAFWNCNGITSVCIPATVSLIEDAALAFMPSLASITVDSANRNYFAENNVLYSADRTILLHYAAQKSDTSFTVPASVYRIDGGAFADCKNLVYVSLPETVDSMGWDIFENCTALTTVNIPSNLTEISSMFNNCSSLQAVTLPDGLISINNDTFKNCSSLQSINIPDTVKKIDVNAFYGCSSLKQIRIPASVTFIGSDAFAMCESLENITVDAANEQYVSVGGALYDAQQTSLICYPAANDDVQEFTIPDSVERIENYAFAGNKYLTRVTYVNAPLTYIGDAAFMGSTALTYFGKECDELPDVDYTPEDTPDPSLQTDGIEEVKLGIAAFAECTALESVRIPDGVRTLEQTFYACQSLVDVILPDSVTSVGNAAFVYCTLLKSLDLPDGLVSIGAQAFGGSGLTELVLPDSVKNIGKLAFVECASLADITLSNSLETIEDSAFAMCQSLTQIAIPASVTQIGDGVFVYCLALEGIYVDENNEQYVSDNGILYNNDCTQLLYYPGGKTDVSFVIPDSVTQIAGAAVAYCLNLEEVEIPAGVTNIGYSAFEGCETLEKLTVRNAECEIFDDEWTFPEQAVIYGYAASTAQSYAETYGREFVALEEDEEEKILYSGECEEGLSWTLSSLGILRISGEGRLTKIIFNSILTPTLPTLVSVLTVIVEGGVESISEDALEKLAGCPDVYILDPYCEIADSAATVPESAVIHGLANSTSKEYADKYGREFEVIEVDCEHVWNSGEVITAPTCSVEGSKLYLCTVCRASKTESIAVDANAHGDNTELRDAQAATQTQPGYTGDLYCLDCGQMLTEGEEIPADVISSFRVESDGVIDEDGIVRLNVYLDDFAGLTSFNLYVDIDETQFTYEGIEFGADSLALNTLMSEEIEVYCNFWQGQVEIAGMFRHCLYSAEHYNNDSINADNFHVITVLLSVNDESVDTLDLTATSIFEFAGCTQDDFTYPAIGFAEDLTATLNTSVHSHDWVLTETVQGTCTQAGSLLYTCSVCGETKTETGTTNPSNHAGGTEGRGAFAETCGKDGYTGDTYCLGCGVKIASGSAIPATGNHTWDNGVVTLEPTYTAPGVRTYTCTVCDATRTEEVEQLVAEYVGDDKSTIMEDVGLVAVAGNKVSDFLANASDGAVILDKNGKEMKADAIPGTGATLVLPDGTEHTIVVLGDVNGDGRVLAGDARLALRSAVGLESLEDSYYKAANVNSVSEVEVADARMILRASVHLEDPADWFESTVQ